MAVETVYALAIERHGVKEVRCYRQLETAKRAAVKEVKPLNLLLEPAWFSSHGSTRLNLAVWVEGNLLVEYTIYTLSILEDWEV